MGYPNQITKKRIGRWTKIIIRIILKGSEKVGIQEVLEAFTIETSKNLQPLVEQTIRNEELSWLGDGPSDGMIPVNITQVLMAFWCIVSLCLAFFSNSERRSAGLQPLPVKHVHERNGLESINVKQVNWLTVMTQWNQRFTKLIESDLNPVTW